MRGIAKESVNIYPQHFARLEQAGEIQLLTPELAVLQNPRLYSDKTGLSQEAEYGKGVFV